MAVSFLPPGHCGRTLRPITRLANPPESFIKPYLVHSSVNFNVNIVSQLVVGEVCAHWDVSLLAESSLEEVPGTGTISLSCWHCIPIYVVLNTIIYLVQFPILRHGALYLPVRASL